MSTLPYVFPILPEEPILCAYDRHWQHGGLGIETPEGALYCESHAVSMSEAFTIFRMERDGHAPPPEEVRT